MTRSQPAQTTADPAIWIPTTALTDPAVGDAVYASRGTGATVDRYRRLWGAADEREQFGLDVCVIGDVGAQPVLTALT
jgi:hypothetical protein